MDRRESGSSGGPKPARRFSFSWADEVEREEQEQRQQEVEDEDENQPPPRRGGETEGQTKANPFGAARPREVVLAEKGVDWRARDRELDDAASRRGSAIRSRSRVHGTKRQAGAAPVPARRHEDSTPAPVSRRKISAAPISYGSAWGGKWKCAGQDEPHRQVRSVGDDGRRVFGLLNIGEEGEFSRRRCSENRGSVCTERIGASKAAIVHDEITDSTVPVSAGTAAGGSGVGRRRRRRSLRKIASKNAK